MVNLPLVKDQLGIRVVAYSQSDGGYIDNDYLHVKDINKSSVAGGRIALRAKPAADLTIDLFALYQKFESDAGNATVRSVGELKSNLPAYDPFNDKVQLYGATVQYQLPFMTVTGNASYYQRDLDFNFLFPNLGIPFTSPTVLATAIVQQPQTTKAKTYELRASSPESWKTFTWTLGVFRQERKAFTRSNLPFAGADGQPNYNLPRYQDRTIKSFIDQTAVFGEVSYTFFDRLTATAGIRWFDYKVGSQQAFAIATGGGMPAQPGVYTGAAPFSQSDYITKLGLSYNATRDVLLYALRSEGFRPGGANQTVSSSIPVGFASDRVINYEAGIKSQWFNRSVTANFSYYHLIWDDIQVDGSTPDGLFRFTTNAGQAKVDGIEVELSAQPIRDLSLGLSYGYVDARLSEDQPFILGVPRRAFSSQRIPAVPRHTVSGWIEKSMPVSGDLTASVRLDAQYVSGSQNAFNPYLVSAATGAPTTMPDPYFASYEGYGTVDLSVALKSAANWTVRLSSTNLFDERGITYVFKDNFRPAGYTYLIRPRTVGLSFTVGL
jgi:outer membrane receptor protein involved in Fe transport